MKKTKIMLAVFGLMLAASAARAGDIVDFDGKKGAIDFMEAIKSVDSCQNNKTACEQPKPAVVSVGDIEMPVNVGPEEAGAW